MRPLSARPKAVRGSRARTASPGKRALVRGRHVPYAPADGLKGRGLDVSKDDDREALERRGADGDSEAMFLLGRLARKSGDLEAARDWYLKAAELGDSTAMVNLGVLAHEAGDLDAARDWYLKAAELSDSLAMFMLGVLARESGDLEAAREWLLKAAEHGVEDAAALLNQLDE